jgi:ribosomal-protein-alanine N-acetyltransferase
MNLAVHDRARRHGFAAFLLQKCLERGARAGAVRALLEVRASNAAARTLYSRSGFVLLGERKAYYADPPEDALVLGRELSHGSSLN